MAKNSKTSKVVAILAKMSPEDRQDINKIRAKTARLRIKDALIYNAKAQLKKSLEKIASNGESAVVKPSDVFSGYNVKDVLIINRAVEVVGLEKTKNIVAELTKIHKS